ncbi:hypothetical protein LSH36_1077g00018 [Paralvinella palmiformis]|uniref:Ig-like domain-containing protein n=1 Tax=Paralvinella palmiformis TaxID=53620 RepID=A0AAD9MQD3_9ANNE|nr:hypothetical protein LSH36_1077g00018 [Paralvinella palmiformis]
MSGRDSGNYTCDVSGPGSAILGIVRYTVHVKAAVEKVYIVQGNASSSTSDQSTTPTITFVEGEPTPVRCIARGGSPPPEIEISIGRSDYTKYFRFDSVPAMSGDVGFRSLRMTTMLVTDNFRATADDDGKRLNCIAKVPGLTEVLKSIIVTVNYAPRIDCKSSAAYVGDRNIRVTCDVTARPPVTSWYWILDDNGTTVSEGEVMNGYWTIVTYLDGKMHLELYFREAVEESFRKYTLVARNTVEKRSAVVLLTRKYRDAESNPQSSAEQTPPYRKQHTRGRSNRDPSSLISGSGAMHHGPALTLLSVALLLCVH